MCPPGYHWVNSHFSFDNFKESLATLTVVSTRQGWYLIFYQVADATEHEAAAVEENSILTAAVFFCTFILINGFISRRRDCHLAGTPFLSLLKRLRKGEGGAAE